MPKVSVIIPTYNRVNVVAEAIQSVLDQTMNDLEVIVVDDGSTDNTRQTIEAIGDPRIRYFYKQNSGPAGARNTGLDETKGDYVAFLDSDDYWPIDYLAVMLSKLQKYPEYGAVYSPITVVFPDGRNIKSYKCPEGKEGWISTDLFKNGFIWPSAALFRTESWRDFSFDEGLNRSSEDSDAFLRLSAKTQFAFTSQVESYHRISDDSISMIEGVNENRLLSLERFYFRLGGDQFIPKRTAYKKLGKVCRKLAEYCRQNNQRTAAIISYKKAVFYQPLDMRLYMGLLKSLCLSKKVETSRGWGMSVSLDTVQTCRKTGIARKDLSNIVFTKNRPLQLQAYLKSSQICFPPERVHTYILWKPELFDTEYQQVFDEFPNCRVIRETNFHDDFVRLINELDTEYVNFGTDDVVYYDRVELDVVKKTFEIFSGSIFGFSLRISPQNLIDPKECVSSQVAGQTVWQIDWTKTQDKTAGYPFELNGTVYKTELVREILKTVSKEHPRMKKLLYESWVGKIISLFSSLKNFKPYVYTYRTPNSLEGLCARWCKAHKSRFPKDLFFQKLCASAIQVNIVNTEIDNPVDGGEKYSVEELNKQFTAGYRLDIQALKENKPQTTHAGKDCFQLKK